MGYPSRHYLDSMANLYHSNKFYNDAFSNNENPFNDTARDREAFWRAEFQEFQPIMQTMLQEMRQTREMMERMLMGPIRNHRYNDTHVDYGIRVRHTRHQRLAPINQPPVYEDLSDDDVSCVQPVSNHIYEFPNRKPIYEDNVSYGKKMELSLEKQYVQPQPLVPTTVPVEEYPPQAQLITITTEINDNGDSFKEDNQVEGDIKKKIFGEIIIEGDKKGNVVSWHYLHRFFQVSFSGRAARYLCRFLQVSFFGRASCDLSQRKLEDEFFSSGGV
jgi:hypothetical protein